MILVVSNVKVQEDSTIDERDKYMNTRPTIDFLEKYKIEYKLCFTLEDILAVDRSTVKGIILSGSLYRFNGDLNGHAIQKITFIMTEYQRPNIIPVYGMCFSCQFIVITYGGSVAEFHKLFGNDTDATRITLDDSFQIHKGGNKEDSFYIGFYDLPVVNDTFLTYFDITSHTTGKEDLPMSFKHKQHEWYFSMFHPEGNPSNYWIMLNFIKNVCGEDYTPLPDNTKGGKRKTKRKTRHFY